MNGISGVEKRKRAASADAARWLKRGGYLLFHFRSTIGVAGFNFSVRNGKRWSPRAITTLVGCSDSGAVCVCALACVCFGLFASVRLRSPARRSGPCCVARKRAEAERASHTAVQVFRCMSYRSACDVESGRGTVPGVRLRLFFAPRGLATRCLLFVFVLYLGLLPERVRVISIARLRRYRRYTCDLSTSSSLTTLVWRSYLEGGFVLRCFQHLSVPDAATRRCAWRHNR